MSNNGVGYNNNNTPIESGNGNDNENDYFSLTNCYNQESRYTNNSDNLFSYIDIVSLNIAIVSLSKNLELICNFARSAYMSSPNNTAACASLSNANNV